MIQVALFTLAGAGIVYSWTVSWWAVVGCAAWVMVSHTVLWIVKPWERLNWPWP